MRGCRDDFAGWYISSVEDRRKSYIHAIHDGPTCNAHMETNSAIESLFFCDRYFLLILLIMSSRKSTKALLANMLARHPKSQGRKPRDPEAAFRELYRDEVDPLTLEKVVNIPPERRVYIERNRGIYNIHNKNAFRRYAESAGSSERGIVSVTNPNRKVTREELRDAGILDVRSSANPEQVARNTIRWASRGFEQEASTIARVVRTVVSLRNSHELHRFIVLWIAVLIMLVLQARVQVPSGQRITRFIELLGEMLEDIQMLPD